MRINFKINFYRDRDIRKKEAVTRIKKIIIPSVIISLLLASIVIAPIKVKSKYDKGLMSIKNAEVIKIKRLKARYDDLKRKVDETKELQKFLNWFETNTMPWGDKLAALGESVPKDVWLTDFSIKEEKDSFISSRQILTIKGMVKVTKDDRGNKSLNRITKLIIQINNKESFKKDFFPVNLKFVKRISMGNKLTGSDTIEFELNGRLREG